MPESVQGFTVEEAAAVFGYEDQMNVHGEDAVSTVPQVLSFVHIPEYALPVERRQTYKFELRPNGEQERLMRRTAGCVRLVYNQALALQKEMYELSGNKHTRYQLDKLLSLWKQETPWLLEVPSHSLQQALVDLERAFANFFHQRTKFPKFHRKGRHTSFRESDPACIQLDQSNSRIRLPKIGWVRYRNSREVLGEVRNVTVSESCGKWFISIRTLREVERPVHPSDSTVGLDWGVTRFFTLSNGRYENQLAPLKKFLPKLARLQRRLARKKKFSQNWKKAKARITKLHMKIANIRKDFVNKASGSISKNHAMVCVEDLQVQHMSASATGKGARAKSGLNRCILDASPFELRRQLEYKTAWRGGLLVPVPPQNRSRTCPCCEQVSKDNRKSQSEFVCVACSFSENADLVGAINIKRLGIASIACSSASGDVSPSCQEPAEGILAA